MIQQQQTAGVRRMVREHLTASSRDTGSSPTAGKVSGPMKSRILSVMQACYKRHGVMVNLLKAKVLDRDGHLGPDFDATLAELVNTGKLVETPVKTGMGDQPSVKLP